MTMVRRDVLKLGGLLALGGLARAAGAVFAAPHLDTPAVAGKADFSLRIDQGTLRLAPGHEIRTLTYNGQFPGPLLRLHEGRPVVIDLHNATDAPQIVHWHGLHLPAEIDGAAEEGTPWIAPGASTRVAFTPRQTGLRMYHTHQGAGSDLGKGLYSGLIGPLYVQPRHDPGRYDREVFLVLKEFAPRIAPDEDMDMDFLAPAGREQGLVKIAAQAVDAAKVQPDWESWSVAFGEGCINGHRLGHGEPLRVRHGERVLLHILNASAMVNRSLALPGHRFRVLALDGNPVARPAEVPVLWLGAAERVSAEVTMDAPGCWILGDIDADERGKGMGIVVEYAGAKGPPQWRDPPPFRWDYRRFADPAARLPEPDHLLEMTFVEHPFPGKGFNRWAINGVSFAMDAMQPMFTLRRGARYRLRMHNASDDAHPIHLHRHTFDIAAIAGQPLAGVRKDVALVAGYQTMDIDFTADQPGLSLFHCHMQPHMDNGFMALLACS